MESCYRHPDKLTGVKCQRCDRPICGECVRSASVGVHCPQCQIDANRQQTTTWRTMHDNQREYGLDRRSMDAQIGSLSMQGRLGARTTVTKALIVINICVYLGQMLTNVFSGQFMIVNGGFAPIIALSEPWRFLTSGFLHSGFFHLLLNMFALYIFGQALEPLMGHLRFATVYFASLVAGSLGMTLWGFVDPTSVFTLCVGASGAIFGLFGALFVIQRRVDASNAGLIVLLAINAFSAVLYPNIAWQAHLGGLIVGAFVMWILFKTSNKERTRAAQRKVNWLVMIAVLLVLLAINYGAIYALLPTLSI